MKPKITAAVCVCVFALLLGTAVGSVFIPLTDILAVVAHKVFGIPLPETVPEASSAIIWKLRLPRTLLAFTAGGALSVSGAVMQSVLRNPLASSYTLGVSSGASFGAGLVVFFGISLPFIGLFSLPFFGFVFGLLTIIAAVAFASRLDGAMENNTIILVGMVFSLFINAVITIMAAISKEQIQRLLHWQMGSFAMKGTEAVLILAPLAVLLTVFIYTRSREMDIMTFGEDQARTVGVNLAKTKWALLVSSAALTGGAIAFSGVIGFVDLVAPHVVRKLFGASHKVVIPMSALFGGAFTVVCDLTARTVIPNAELPVGAVTALIGAPFFAYVYFAKSKRKK